MDPIASLYPPAPPSVPPDLTAPSAGYRARVLLVLGSLIAFMLFYVALVVASGYLFYWALTYPLEHPTKGPVLLKLGLIGMTALLFLFLLKSFFKRPRTEKRELMVEVTQRDQPTLFAFIRRVCQETGAPFPHRVYLSPEVNAAVFYHESVLSLVLPTPKNLLVGLGLVNALNLREFKATLAHEFGHFSQNSMKLGQYVYSANRILTDMVYGRDWLDDLVDQAKGTDLRVAVFAYALLGVLWAVRKTLAGCFRVINFASFALSRQMEFNADLVAVSVAGSDSLVRGLARLPFAEACLEQAWEDLSAAAQHSLYTNDLFHHQEQAARYLRALHDNPSLGEPPPVPEDPRFTVQVFQPEDEPPSMWSTHPSNYDREQNVKRRYLRCPPDDRSPWLLFDDAPAVRAAVTRRLYEVTRGLPPDAPLTDARQVQAFIDDEHAETTYSPRYHGLYDDRYLHLASVNDLTESVKREPLGRAELSDAVRSLYGEDLKAWLEGHAQRKGEYALLAGLDRGEYQLRGKDFELRGARHTQADVPRLLAEVDTELEADRARLGELDAKVFRLHYQMARELGGGLADELVTRYGFHLGVQEIVRRLGEHHVHVNSALQFLSGNRELSEEQFAEVRAIFHNASVALDRALLDSRNLYLPALKSVTAGEQLRGFLLDGAPAPPPAMDTSLDGEWIGKLLEQLNEVLNRARRIHFKSLGGILALQEKLAQEWSAAPAEPPGPGPDAPTNSVPATLPEESLP